MKRSPKQLGRKPMKMVENHHNFAWKEMHNGKEVIVHRKGATPAGKDVLGIIPGSHDGARLYCKRVKAKSQHQLFIAWCRA